MKRYIHSVEDIMCMSDVRGSKIKVEKGVPFSFYYSVRNASHGPRVKIAFDPNRIKSSRLCNLQLCDDWDFTEGTDVGKIKNKEITIAREFFRKYLILFLLVWEELVDDEASVRDYLEGAITLHEFIKGIEFYDANKEQLDDVNTISELEDFCRKGNLVNFYGN